VPYYLPEQSQPEMSTASRAYFRSVTPGYFTSLQIPLLYGRHFSLMDTKDTPQVVIVNEALARKLFEGGKAVGRELRFFWSDWQTYDIVGVVANTRSYGLSSKVVPELYVPDSQIPYGIMNVVIRFERNLPSAENMIRSTFDELDSLQPPQQMTTLTVLTKDSIQRERFAAALLSAFSIVGLFLAIGGIYGTISYNTVTRTREIGLRMALGATVSRIRYWVLKDAVNILIPGFLIGAAGSFAAVMAIQNQLFGLSPFDPVTIIFVSLLITLAALLASLIPASKAASVDPLQALRNE
jgi:ABC-type antimicrobial peptide transport system permease subunit